MFLTGIHSSAIQLPESKEAIILPMSRKSMLLLLLIAAGIVGGLTAAGGEREEHDGRQQEGGKGSELHGGGFLSCDEVDFSKTGESCFFRVFALPMQTKNKAVNAL